MTLQVEIQQEKKTQHARDGFVHHQIQGTVKCQENAGNMVKLYKDIGRMEAAARAIEEVIEHDNQKVALKVQLVEHQTSVPSKVVGINQKEKGAGRTTCQRGHPAC